MANDQDSNIEIIESEDFYGEKGKEFSHSALVMASMRKCIESGCREMRMGYFNSKTDKFGNLTYTYIEDTRKNFIESVKTTEMVMADDMDEEADKNIKEIKEDIKKRYDKLCGEEEEDWKQAHIKIMNARALNGIMFRRGFLNPSLPYAQDYVEEQVNLYRDIFRELKKLTKRRDYYKAEEYEA